MNHKSIKLSKQKNYNIPKKNFLIIWLQILINLHRCQTETLTR